MISEVFLRVEQVAARYYVHPSTIWGTSTGGQMSGGLKFGDEPSGLVRWRLVEYEAWLRELVSVGARKCQIGRFCGDRGPRKGRYKWDYCTAEN